MPLPKHTIERLCKETTTIIHWLDSEHKDLVEPFMLTFCETIKTCKTEPMDSFFRPIILAGVLIPENVLQAITAFTQVTSEYTPKQRSLKL